MVCGQSKKISHKQESVVEDVFKILMMNLVNTSPLLSHKEIYDYLGMNMDYTDSEKLIHTMSYLIQIIIKRLPANVLTGPLNTPPANHLFKVNPEATQVNAQDAELFHSMKAQLLDMYK